MPQVHDDGPRAYANGRKLRLCLFVSLVFQEVLARGNPRDRRDQTQLLFRPGGQHVAAGVGEMEAAAAREFKSVFHDFAACGLYFRLTRDEVRRIDHDERTTGRDLRRLVETSREAAVFKARVPRSVVGELPTEDLDIGQGRIREAIVMIQVVKCFVLRLDDQEATRSWKTVGVTRPGVCSVG